jgi:hypothetical protein
VAGVAYERMFGVMTTLEAIDALAAEVRPARRIALDEIMLMPLTDVVGRRWSSGRRSIAMRVVRLQLGFRRLGEQLNSTFGASLNEVEPSDILYGSSTDTRNTNCEGTP